METEITIEVKARVTWKIDGGIPIVESVELIGGRREQEAMKERIAAAMAGATARTH